MSELIPNGGDRKRPQREDGDPRRKGDSFPALEIVFEGSHVSPRMVLANDLFQVIRAVQCLAMGRISDRSSQPPDAKTLRLIGVRRDPARYTLAGPSPKSIRENLRAAGDVIEHPDTIGENDHLLRTIGILSRASKRTGFRIAILESGFGGTVLARVGPETFGELRNAALIVGRTEFGGTVEWVGGATRKRCGLRVAFQQPLLVCRLTNPAVAQRLGENLDQHVIVSGEAAWFKSSWRVFSFRADAARPIRQGSLSEAIKAIRDAGGSDWDQIADVRAFLDLDEPFGP